MYLSSAYISKIFKEETGEAPINYLIKMRLERARIQLESDNGQSIKPSQTALATMMFTILVSFSRNIMACLQFTTGVNTKK